MKHLNPFEQKNYNNFAKNLLEIDSQDFNKYVGNEKLEAIPGVIHGGVGASVLLEKVGKEEYSQNNKISIAYNRPMKTAVEVLVRGERKGALLERADGKNITTIGLDNDEGELEVKINTSKIGSSIEQVESDTKMPKDFSDMLGQGSFFENYKKSSKEVYEAYQMNIDNIEITNIDSENIQAQTYVTIGENVVDRDGELHPGALTFFIDSLAGIPLLISVGLKSRDSLVTTKKIDLDLDSEQLKSVGVGSEIKIVSRRTSIEVPQEGRASSHVEAEVYFIDELIAKAKLEFVHLP